MNVLRNKSGFIFILSAVFVICSFSACPAKRSHQGSLANQPPAPTYLEHVVKYQGENLGVISAWYTGKSANWKVIRDANPGLRPEAIRLGQIIRIPHGLVTNSKPFPKEMARRVAPPSSSQSAPSISSNEEEEAVEKGDSEAVAPTQEKKAPELTEALTAPSTNTTTDVAPTTVDVPAAKSAEANDANPGTTNSAEDDAERERLLKELLGQ